MPAPTPAPRENRPQPEVTAAAPVPTPAPREHRPQPEVTAAAPPRTPAPREHRPQPDPAADVLLALAEHIRAAQIAQPAPVATAGLPDLAAAVRAEQLPTPDLIPVPVPAPVEASAKSGLAPLPATQAIAQPVALLAPPAPPVAEPAPPGMADPFPAALPKPAAPGAPAKNNTAPLIQPPPQPIRETTADKFPSGSWLRLAPLLDYTDAATRGMHPVVPLPKIATPDCGPRITLPGPLLPPELQQRKNLRVLTAVGQQKRRITLPGWMVSLAAMLALLIVGIFAVTYLLPASHSAANAKTAVAPVETPANSPEASHALSEYIEVTGFRFVMDLNKKSEIHYLVVNHSASELSDMTVYVTVKTANAKPGQPPVCRFSFRSPGLAPFESREMVSSIEKLSRPITLPDWHDLKADVQISE
ncbi:MAG TPA: hypothetical protein VMG40_21440 [Bryobacteraceae bacterium]|nr:hypothetical protein [Bryobacteraceae bacterium]